MKTVFKIIFAMITLVCVAKAQVPLLNRVGTTIYPWRPGDKFSDSLLSANAALLNKNNVFTGAVNTFNAITLSTALDTAYSNSVSNILVTAPLSVATSGKAKFLSLSNLGSMYYVDSTKYHGSASINTLGILTSGSIASGFGTINIGSNTINSGAITSTGAVSVTNSNGITVNHGMSTNANGLKIVGGSDGNNLIAEILNTDGSNYAGWLKMYRDSMLAVQISASTGFPTYFNGGDVGIGTTVPQGHLDVRKDQGGLPTRIVVNNSGTVQAGTASRFSMYEGGTETGYLQTTRDGSGLLTLMNVSNADIDIGTNNTAGKLRITTTGNIGIGTTTPLHKQSTIASSATNLNAFNFVDSDRNTIRTTLAQEADTSSFNLNFSGQGTPVLSLINGSGVVQFKSDSIDFTIGTNLKLGSSATLFATNIRPVLAPLVLGTQSEPVGIGFIGVSFPSTAQFAVKGNNSSRINLLELHRSASSTAVASIDTNGTTTFNNVANNANRFVWDATANGNSGSLTVGYIYANRFSQLGTDVQFGSGTTPGATFFIAGLGSNLTNQFTFSSPSNGVGVSISNTGYLNVKATNQKMNIQEWYRSATNLPVATIDTNGNFTGGNIVAQANLYFSQALAVSGKFTMRSPSDGVVTLYNSAENNFSRLNFGGTASAFPALKRNGALLEVRLADDSGYSSLVTSQYRLSALNTGPSSASDTGIIGEIRVDATYIYICIATNTWKRVAIASW